MISRPPTRTARSSCFRRPWARNRAARRRRRSIFRSSPPSRSSTASAIPRVWATPCGSWCSTRRSTRWTASALWKACACCGGWGFRRSSARRRTRSQTSCRSRTARCWSTSRNTVCTSCRSAGSSRRSKSRAGASKPRACTSVLLRPEGEGFRMGTFGRLVFCAVRIQIVGKTIVFSTGSNRGQAPRFFCRGKAPETDRKTRLRDTSQNGLHGEKKLHPSLRYGQMSLCRKHKNERIDFLIIGRLSEIVENSKKNVPMSRESSIINTIIRRDG